MFHSTTLQPVPQQTSVGRSGGDERPVVHPSTMRATTLTRHPRSAFRTLGIDETRGRPVARSAPSTAQSSREVSPERARTLSPPARAAPTLPADQQDLRWFEDKLVPAVANMVASIKDEIELAAADTDSLRRQPDSSDDEPEIERASAVVNDHVSVHTQISSVSSPVFSR